MKDESRSAGSTGCVAPVAAPLTEHHIITRATVETTADVAAVFEHDDEDIVRLRVWGSDVIYPLPHRPSGQLFIGTSSDCAIQIADRFAAAKHAELSLAGAH